jgi:tetratricopeptide (TPR) repeat protein
MTKSGMTGARRSATALTSVEVPTTHDDRERKNAEPFDANRDDRHDTVSISRREGALLTVSEFDGEDVIRPWPVTTPFLDFMLTLRDSRPTDMDTYTSAVWEALDQRDPSHYLFPLSQVLEPEVISECALLAGVPAEPAHLLAEPESELARQLVREIRTAPGLDTAARVNLATVLLALARPSLARDVLPKSDERPATARDRFEVAMVRFIIANRTDGEGQSQEFAAMRAAIADGPIPPDRALDACTQAVVWFMKSRVLEVEDFEFFLSLGQRLADEGRAGVPVNNLSSWHRGVAMVHADAKDARATRIAMESARELAVEASGSGRTYERHLHKTYLESSVKEFMYVTRDRDRAVASAEELVELDPLWSVSRGELGEALAFFGDLDAAAAAFDEAVRIGPPYVGYHLLRSARAYAKAQRNVESAQRYLQLSLLGGLTDALMAEAAQVAVGTDLARRVEHCRKRA